MIAEMSKLYANARSLVKLTDESGLDTEGYTSADKVGTEKTSGWFRHGDYELCSDKDGEWILNYRPHILKDGGYDTSLFIDDVDPEMVDDFEKPPREMKEP